MKTLLLIVSMVFFGLPTFSYSPGNTKTKIAHTQTGNLNALYLQEFLKLTPKKYHELTGKRMNLKEKLAFAIVKAKLKKQLAEEAPAKKSNLGLLSLIFGSAAWLFALIPGLAVVSLGLGPAAIVLGILALGKNKHDTKAIIGLVLGGLFTVLVLIALATYASGGWW